MNTDLLLHPIGVIRSTIKERKHAPKQGSEGAPEGSEIYTTLTKSCLIQPNQNKFGNSFAEKLQQHHLERKPQKLKKLASE